MPRQHVCLLILVIGRSSERPSVIERMRWRAHLASSHKVNHSSSSGKAVFVQAKHMSCGHGCVTTSDIYLPPCRYMLLVKVKCIPFGFDHCQERSTDVASLEANVLLSFWTRALATNGRHSQDASALLPTARLTK